ncbi:uncharacterized protein JCM15063_005004 [Sporobolomyces koalae]|uniref:uncharacterized protein n=1 Tax=Sporobolomyces koalae TaxID=500713 RepID=UPI00317ED7EB
MLDLFSSDSDSAFASQGESLWKAKIWDPEEKALRKARLVHDTRAYRELMNADAADDPDTIIIYGANDHGIAYPAALIWYFPLEGKAYFDSLSKDRHAGAQRTRSRTQRALGAIDGSNERDEYFILCAPA